MSETGFNYYLLTCPTTSPLIFIMLGYILSTFQHGLLAAHLQMSLELSFEVAEDGAEDFGL